MAIPHPIPYQGSKRRLAPEILAFFPDGVERLVEPFAGSAAVSLAAAVRERASRFLINDAHLPLAELWRAIIERPEELSHQYAKLWNAQLGRERQYYDAIRARFNKTHRPEHLLYLLARCVKAAVRYNGNGAFNNSPDNRRRGATPGAMHRRLTEASALLRGRTAIDHEDYTRIVARCEQSDLIYMDPPYQGVCRDRDGRYALRFDHEEFRDVLDALNRKRFLYLVSYDGRSGARSYGKPLPSALGLTRVELRAGRSTQATLLGKKQSTYESLYLSPALAKALARQKQVGRGKRRLQLDNSG